MRKDNVKKFITKKAFTIEEMVGGTVIIALAFSVFSNVKIYEMSICNIITIFMIMVFAMDVIKRM